MSVGRKIGLVIMVIILAICAVDWITSLFPALAQVPLSWFWKWTLFIPPLYGLIVPIVISGRSAFFADCSSGRYIGGLFASTIIAYIGMWIGVAIFFNLPIFHSVFSIITVVISFFVFLIPIALSLISVKIFNAA